MQDHTKAPSKPALMVAHPGHELRVHGWMEAVQPLVCVLTHGRSVAESRLDCTTELVTKVGARPGSIYGRTSDREIYSAVLAHDFDGFVRLADELAEWLFANEIDCLVGDAAEGYNPSHDVCRLVINAAARIARKDGLRLAVFAFPVVGDPRLCPDHLRSSAVLRELDELALSRKLDAARSYAKLASEVEHALRHFGPAAFRTEWLWPVDPAQPYGLGLEEVPYYERYGEQRVADGAYGEVLRLREHMLPLAEALSRHG